MNQEIKDRLKCATLRLEGLAALIKEGPVNPNIVRNRIDMTLIDIEAANKENEKET